MGSGHSKGCHVTNAVLQSAVPECVLFMNILMVLHLCRCMSGDWHTNQTANVSARRAVTMVAPS